MRKSSLAILGTALLMFSVSAMAENSTAIGEYVIHHNAITTDNLSPQMASAYGLQRSKGRAMLNVSVIKGKQGRMGTPVAAKIDATTRNVIGQTSTIALREVREGNAIYYIGDFPVAHRETLDFFLQVTPEGENSPFKAQLRQEFYTD